MKVIVRPTLLLFIVLSVTLSGCASYQAYREGNSRLDSGDVVGGISKLHEAMDLDPDNTQYRQFYFDQRDRAVNRTLREGDRDLEAANFDAAGEAYRMALSLDAGNVRAVTALAKLEAAREQKATLDAAELLVSQGDLEEAVARVHKVLETNPNHPRALALSHQFAQQIARVTQKEFSPYPKLKKAYRKPVTLSLTNATLLQAFDSIKLASGLNFMFDRDVKTDAKTTISVTNKPVEDVVRILLAANQLEKRVLDEDTILIYPNTSQKAGDYKDLVTRTFYLAYADIKQMASLLKSVVKAKDVFVDEKLNVLIVRDSPEVISLAEKLIANEDVADPEVVLELEVLEIDATKLLQLGVQWPSSVAANVQGAGGQAGQVTLGELHGPKAGLVNLTFSSPLASAQLLEQAGDSDILANPRIRVRNRETAKVLIGKRVPVVSSNAVANVGVSQAVSYLDVGLKLEIEPTISLDQDVSMKVALEVSSIQGQTTLQTGTIVYTLGTRNASTVLRVHDNETQVLAGLIQHDQENSNTGIPGLNDIPVLNKLFGQANNTLNQTEVVLLITPHIVRNVQVPGIERLEILSGTENNLGASPIQLGKASGAAASSLNQPRPLAVPINPATPVSPASANVQAVQFVPAPLNPPPPQNDAPSMPAANPGPAPPASPPAFSPPPIVPSAPETLPSSQ